MVQNIKGIQLPSNRKFGFFFTFIFGLVAAYFLYDGSKATCVIFSILSVILFLVTLFKSEALFPFNKLWMRFGLLLGLIISPVVLGFIFFGLFAPVAIFTRIFGRDELLLKQVSKRTYWIDRKSSEPTLSMKQQF